MDSFQCRDSDSSDDESSDEGSDSDEVDNCGFDSGFDIQIDNLDSRDFVSKEGNIYHLCTAKEKFLNDGKFRMSGQSRKKRITGVNMSKMSMRPACPIDDESCKTIVAGDFGHFTRKAASSRSEADSICNGLAIFLIIRLMRLAVLINHQFIIHRWIRFVTPTKGTTAFGSRHPILN
jgi:hypothetical protein